MKGVEAHLQRVQRRRGDGGRPTLRAVALGAAVAVGLLTACDVARRSGQPPDAAATPGATGADTPVWREAALLAGVAAAFGFGLGAVVRRRTAAGAEAEARRAERFHRDIGDAVPGKVAFWDRTSHCRHANRAFLEALGKTAEEVIGRSPADLFGAAFDAQARARLEAALNGVPQQFERSVIRPDGSTRTERVHYTPHRGPSGETDGVCAMVFDVTALKAGETALAAANAQLAAARDAAEAAARAKGALLAHASHAVRAPLSAILGLTHLLGREAAAAPQHGRLDKVAAATQQLLAVVDEVLELSQIEPGGLVLDAHDFARDEWLGRSVEEVAERARAKGIELVLDTDHLPPRLRGDALRLSQMLLPLLETAVTLTTASWVCLRGRLLERRGERLHLRFEVEDAGVGLSAAQQARLFGALMPAHRRDDGSRLALTRKLARAMDGDAGVASAQGVGSVFWFTVWVDRAAGPETSASPSLPAGLRVLLVDDLAEARGVIAGRLRTFGAAVDTAESGTEALRQAEVARAADRRHDVLLIDAAMPGVDGLETWRRLREAAGGAAAPALLMLAFDDPGVRRRAQAAGIDGVLVKPPTPSTLQAALRRALRLDGAAAAPTGRRGASEVERRLQREHAGQSVLVVADHPLDREIASDLLDGVGLRVEVAGDAAEALEKARARRHDLILMDMRSLVPDDLEATHRWRRGERGARPPIVALTTDAFGDDRAACLAAGLDDHLVKPVLPERLYATLAQWLPARPELPAAAAPSPAGAAAGAALIRRFETVDGLEVSTALRNVGGQAQFLAQVLERFVESYAAGEPSLLAAPSDESLQRWRALCHSIRGAAATIGAARLADDAQALESGLRSGAQAAVVAAQASELHEALKSLAGRLATALARGQPG